jgi:Na+/melibiose symporter-like transporter
MRAEEIAAPARSRWLGAGAAAGLVAWGTNQFTPMLLFYRARLGLSGSVANAIFGVYAAGVIAGLLLIGPLSDRLGRRRVLLAAMGASIAADIALIGGSHAVGLLYAGRLIMGLAAGSAFSSGAAWIKELSGDAPPAAGARRASVAINLGFLGGPLAAGLLAQWAPDGGVLPYLPHLVLTAAALPFAARTSETVPLAGPRGNAAFGGWPAVRYRSDPRFLRVVVPVAPWVFGSVAIAMVYAPGLEAKHAAGLPVAFAALVAVTCALASVLVIPLARRLAGSARQLLTAGLTLIIAGLATDVAAVITAAWGPLLVVLGAAILGAGYGCILVFGLAQVQSLARADELATMTAVFQALAYTGFALPVVLSALQHVASPSTLLLALAGLAAATLAWVVRAA